MKMAAVTGSDPAGTLRDIVVAMHARKFVNR
jgi:hypothetical protein